MVPQARLNPEAPQFLPNQHHQQQLQSLSWPAFSTSITPPQYFFVLPSPPPPDLNPLQTPCVYYPTITAASTSLSFHHGTNPSQQLCTPLLPLLASEGEPGPLEARVDKVQQEEVVVGAEEVGSKGAAQHKVFRTILRFGKKMEINQYHAKGVRLQACAWRRKSDAGDDQRCGHSKNRQVFRRVEYFRAFPKKKPLHPAVPVRVDGEETTIMIKNVPNKYTRNMLLEFLDNHCRQENQREKESNVQNGEEHTVLAFDLVYLPIDFKSGLNKGYAFVNFTNPKAAWKFHLTANNNKWDLFQSHKIREVVAARLQGKEKLQSHFENMNFPCESEEVLPVCFSPPRDGVRKGEARTMGRLGRGSHPTQQL